MSTHGTPAAPGQPSHRPGLGTLHLLLLSIAVGFGVSFGGSLLLAGQIAVPTAGAFSQAELVQVSGSDRTALAPALKAPSTPEAVGRPAVNQRPIRRDELGTDEQVHRIYVCTVHTQPDPASEQPEHLWACIDTSDDG
jgi:hypothetical protein